VGDLEVKQVQVTEIPGASNNGSSLYRQDILAGSIERLSEVLMKRQVKASARLVIDVRARDDSYSRLVKYTTAEKVLASDAYTVSECLSPSNVLYSLSNGYSELKCVRLA